MSDVTANNSTVYKQVSDEMRQGLRRIYQEIVSASSDGKTLTRGMTNCLPKHLLS